MLMHDPAISVLMPAFNAETYIGEAISSVLNQGFANFELVIVNDGSTDNTERVIRSFNDPRIVLVNQANGGIAAALNRGLAIARAGLVARFDADDICCAERLQVQYDFLSAHPDYIITGSDADFIDRDNNHVFTYSPPWHSNEAIQALEKSICPFIHSGVLFRKEVIIQAGGYNQHAHAFEDHLLWRKIVKQGKVCNIPKVLLKVRLNPESITIDEKWHHKRFLEIKYQAIEKGSISAEEGNELKSILIMQGNRRVKEGAYYSLLGKKYLWNNYQPRKARTNLKKTLRIQPLDINTWVLFLLSYMPEGFIQKLYARWGTVK